MGEKLPDGWFNPFPGDLWSHPTGAAADLHRPHGNFRAAVYGPDRATKEEAEQDRLNLIAGLEGGADILKAREQIHTLLAKLDRSAERHDAIVECLDAIRAPQEATIPERIYAWRNGVQAIIASFERDRDAALKELATLKTRRAGDHAEHLATLDEISKALNAYPTVDGVTAHYWPHEIAGAVRAQGKALHEARKDRARLAGELEAVREAGNTFGPDVEAEYIRALAKIVGLRKERDRMRSTIEKQQGEIDGLKAATPQLLRDSMRVTQEESARLKADMARKDAEIAALRQRVAASEAYAQHLLAALNAVSGFKGMP